MVGAVIYVRVSAKEQTENLSLPTQLRACEEYCRRQGYEILERFHEEGESAKTTDRWSKGRCASSLGVSLRKGAAGTGFQIALELNSPLLVGEFDGDVELPRAVARSVRAAAGVVIGEAGEHVVVRPTYGRLWYRTAQDMDDALRWHARLGATGGPGVGVRNPCAIRRVTGSRCNCCGVGNDEGWQIPRKMCRQRRGDLPALLRGFAATAGNLRLAWVNRSVWLDD